MELEKCGDGDHSNEMQSALKKFEEVCNSLEDEHNKLLELEKRRQKLNEDLERLRNEIKEEKKYFRSVIDDSFPDQSDDEKRDYTNEQLAELVEPLTLDNEFIQNQRKEESVSRDNDDNYDDGINQIKASQKEQQFEEIDRQREEAAALSNSVGGNVLDIGDEDAEIFENMTTPSTGETMEYLSTEEE